MSGKSETVGHCGAWLEQQARGESHVYRGPVDCGCGWGDLCDAPREEDPLYEQWRELRADGSTAMSFQRYAACTRRDGGC